MRFFEKRPSRFPLASLSDYRDLARKKLPRPLFDFIDGGAFNEQTRRKNQTDFASVTFRKQVLKDVSSIDPSGTLLGQPVSCPFVLGPVALAGAFSRRGDEAAARAASEERIPFVLSAAAIASFAEIEKTTSVPFWFQFNLLKEPADSLELLQRAWASGCRILMLTVDLPTIGTRYRYDRHNKGTGRVLSDFWHSLTHPAWFVSVRLLGGPLRLGAIPLRAAHLPDLSSMRDWYRNQLSSSFTWKDLEWVRSNWPGKIVLKGILDAADALRALESGMDGIAVSNHGGRHIDCVPSALSILPSIADAIGGRMEILLDGGITNGLDLIKALALGANGCMIGRAWAFALAARGGKGVVEAIQILKKEFHIGMAQLGFNKIGEIDKRTIYT